MSRTLKILLPVMLVCITAIALLNRSRSDDVRPTSMIEYYGRTIEQVLANLGQPYYAASFNLGQPLDQMRIGLYNVYPPDMPGKEKIEIKEMWWKDGDYYITLWFHQVDEEWKVVDGIRWHNTIRF